MKKDTEATRRKPADEKTGTKKPRRTRLIALEPRMLFEGEALTEVRPTDVHQPDAGAKAPTAPQAGAAAPAGEAGTQPAPVDGKSTVLTTDQAGADKTVSADEAGAAPAIEKPGEAARVVEPRAGTERTNVSIISTDLLDAETRENLRQSIDIVEQSLQKFAESAEFKTVMTEIFGGTRSSADFDAAVEQLRAQIENGTLEVRVEVVSSQVLGVHGGAYAAVGAEGKEAIYLNADMLKTATAKEVAGVVLEELGHALDQRINLGVDTIGDEGQLFADRIVGQALTADQAQDIVSEDDHGTLRFADRLVGVEFAAQSPPSSANQTIASFAEDGTPVDLDVSAITFNDPNANDTLKGIVITANNATSAQGTWQYSTDGGTTWSAVGTVSTNNALWLSSNGTTNSIRFLPTGNYSGTVGTLSYYVVSSSDTVSRSDGTRYSIPGSGGTKFGTTDYSTSTYTITQSAIVSSNDAPTVTVAASNSSFSEGAGFGVQGAAVAVFSGSSVSTVESGQSISGLAFTVSGLRDGASETVVVDGTTLSLGGNSAGITLGRLMTYSVTVSGDTATVSLAKLTGVSTSEAQSVIDGIRYQNKNVDDPTGGARTFTLTQLKDTGGTANGGVDTAALSVTSVINVVPVNDAPTLSVTALGPTYNQFASPVALFAGATAGAVESTQSLTSLTLTVSGIADGASEKLTVSGTEFALTNGTAGTLDGTNSVAYSVTTSGNTATITLASASGLSASGMQSLISGIGYRDVSQHPTAGQRIATITRITDSGGSAAGGNDATTLALSSVVTVVPDTTAPDAPTLSLIQSSDTGQSTSDRVTADDTPTVRVALNGSGASAPLAGDVVKVQANGVLVGTVSLTSAHLQAGYVDVTTASVAGDGTHTLTATVTDAAGNTSSASSPLTLTLDRTPPQAPTLALLSTSDTGASSSDRITADDTPTIRVALNGSGASAPVVGDVVTVRSSGAVVGTATLTSAHVQAGYVDVTTASLGADGVKSLTATVTDKAGNESTPSSSLAITLDRTAPALTQAVVDGSRLTLSYSDSVDLDDTNRASPSAYIVTANGVPSSVSAIAVDGTSRTVTLTLAAPVSAGQIVTVAYVDPSVSDDSQATQDLAGNDATSALSLTVTNVTVDHVPQAVADSAAIAEDADTAITGNVLVDDTLGDGTAALHTVTWGNEAAQYGTLTKNADGSYSYVLDNGITEVQRLAPGQFLTETFTYTVRDADGDTATSALTITITGTNDGPVALNTSAQGASSVAVQLSALDTDGTVSTFVLSSLPAHGTLYTDASMTHIVEAGAEYAATNDSLTLYFRPDAGWTGQTNFEFVARDEAGAYADTATATISVSSSTADVYEDGLTRNPPQPESATGALPGGAAGGWSMQSDAQHGTATLGSDGTWSYTVNNDDPAVQALGEGETLVDTFVVSGPRILSTTVQIGDGRSPLTSGHDQTTVLTLPTEFLEGMQAGKLDSSKLTLYTDFQKAPFTTPVSADEQNVGLEEQVEARLVVGSKTFIAVQRNDGQQTWSFDAASGLMKAQVGFDEIVEAQYDAESRSWIPVASGATLKDFLQGNPSIPAQWTAVYDDNEGGPEQARIARFEFTTLGGTPVQETITVTIHGTNDAPVAVADVNTVGEDGAPVSGNVLTNDTDVDAGATKTVSAVGGQAGQVGRGVATAYGTVTVNADGTYTYAVNPALSAVQALNVGQTLSDSVSYTVVDENGASSTATLTITITGTNDAPVVTSPTSVTVAEGHAIDSPVYTIEATDPNNDRLTYSLSGPDADAFAVDAATGEVKFIAPPNFEAKSEYSINVIASDGTEQHVQAVTVRIADVAPVGNDRTVVATEDGAYVFTAADFTFAVGDPNAASGVEAVRIETLPSGGVLKLDGVAVANGAVVTASDIAAGKLTFEPAADANGPGYARFSVSLRDSEGTYTAARNTITVDVSAVNDAPVATGSVALPAGSEDGVSESVTVASLFRTAFNDARDEVAGGSTSGALAGVAIVDYRADPAKGAWQYSPDGTTWITINSVTDPAAAVTLKSTDALRFVPAANFNGPVPAVTVKLIDTSTTVTTGAVVDVRTSGGATAYSADNVLLTHSVAAVAGTPTVVTTDVSGDQDAEIGLPITVTAGDPGEVVSVTLSGIPNGMKFVTSTGEAFTPSTGALTLTAAQVVGLRVTPPEGYTGTLALTVQATETDGTRQASSPSQRVFISVTPRPLPIVPTPVVSSPVIATPVVTAPVISTPAVTAPAVTPEVAAPRPVTAAVASTTIPSSTAVTGAAPAAAATGIPASALPSDGSRNTSPLPTGQINLMQGVNTAAASTVSSPVTSALPASSGAQLDSTDRGFNVIRTAAAAPAAAAAAGAQAAGPALDTAPQRGGDTLFVYQGIPSTAANAGQNLDFTVPREAFGHTNQKAIVQLDAMRTNGQPLPEWIDFDPVSGKFTGKPPRGAEGVIEIKVVARDNEGREATTTFSIRVGDVAPAQSPRPAQQTGAAAAAERIVVGEAGDADEVADKAAEKQAKDGKDRPREQGRDKIRIAALPFSEQLNRAKQDGLLARIMDTKDKAKTKLSPPVREA